MKNAFNKIIAAVWARSARRTTARHLHHTQRGFTFGRNFVNNYIDLDSIGRMYGFDNPADSLALFAFFDIAAAFPSLCHKFLFFVLKAIGLPEGFSNVFRCMYDNVMAYGFMGGGRAFLFQVLSGVLQGCPLSGLAFSLAMDPFLRMFDFLIDKYSRRSNRPLPKQGGC